jgi:hypothetical protein
VIADLAWLSRSRYVLIAAICTLATVPSSADAATRFASPDRYKVDTDSDVATGDLDEDGIPDLASVGPGVLSVWLGDGYGGFEVSTQDLPFADVDPTNISYDLEIHDVDEDGSLDVLVADILGEQIAILKGTGDGDLDAVAPIDIEGYPGAMAFGDFAGDDQVDIAVAVQDDDEDEIQILARQPSGSYAVAAVFPVGGRPFDLAVADLDGDDRVDIVASEFHSDRLLVLMQTAGGFALPVHHQTGDSPGAIEIADLDGDEVLDIIVAEYGAGAVAVLPAESPGSFAPPVSYPVGEMPVAISVRDMNGDDMLDVIAVSSHYQYGIRILAQTPAGSFESAAAGGLPNGGTRGAAFMDFDGDEETDVAVANPSLQEIDISFGDALTLDPDWLDFGELLAGGTATQTLTLRNTGSREFTTTTIALEGDNGVFSIDRGQCVANTLEVGESCAMTATFSAPADLMGEFDAAVVVEGDAWVADRMAFLSGASYRTGFLVPEVSELDFGVTETGVAKQVTVTNAGGTPVEVASARATGSFKAVANECIGIISPSEQCVVTVAAAPLSQRRGPIRGSLGLHAPRGGGTTISFKGSLAGPATVLPPKPDYGGMKAGLARLAHSVPAIIRGGPFRTLRLPAFDATVPGGLGLRVRARVRGKNAWLTRASATVTPGRAHRLRFSLTKRGRALLRRSKPTVIKVIAQFRPSGAKAAVIHERKFTVGPRTVAQRPKSDR